MQIFDGKRLYSASDLVSFLECEHLTALELINLDSPLPRAEDDAQAKLVQDKGLAHETAYLRRLQEAGVEVGDVKQSGLSLDTAVAATEKAMHRGAEVIYQGCLRSGEFLGYIDFLRRVDTPSALGDYGYEVVDTKLARSPKAKFIIQLCLCSDLLAEAQGAIPRRIHLVLGDGTEQSFRLADYFRYYQNVRARFLDRVGDGPGGTYPEPCAHCDLCQWRDLCNARWDADDHLCRVANITKTQIEKLNAAGVATLAGLAGMAPGTSVPGMYADASERLRRQAALQLDKRETGADGYELRATPPGETRGFLRLPRPDAGDLFFDMEGDPLEDGGLEYLFGVYYRDDGEPRFQAFWAHDRHQEREAFTAFIAFVMERLARYPDLHIYHYAAYEESALKRLMSLHGVCEAEVDQLLRAERLVDLYKVVREALLVSEPRYSIKNLETFYMEKREGEVTNAGASIVYYEQWKESQDLAVLEQIRAYNEDDCRSTYLLREWLLGIRPSGLPWFAGFGDNPSEAPKSERVKAIEARLDAYRASLVGALPVDRACWETDAHLRELVFQLLDFHRRAAKPEWWAMFAHREMTEEELIDDPECVGGLKSVPDCPPVSVKQSLVYTYRFPEQEFKLKAGDSCLRADSLERAGVIESVDEASRLLRIKLGVRSGRLPDRLSLIPTGPIDTDVLTEAVFRFADSLVSGTRRYAALEGILRRDLPVIVGRAPGSPVVSPAGDVTAQVSDAASCLRESYVFVQGPPGAGKTYTGSHVILALLEQGFRVGVSSNSHKAINNLLAAVEQRAAERGVRFRGVKKSSRGRDDTYHNGDQIQNVTENDSVFLARADLVAGTAWLFADARIDQGLDYLFVDETGQVALANLVAMGTSARNIVLLGDQMQLQQPIQGVHPGHSGESALEYLLQGQATIPDDRGVFLDTTWRMHGDVCGFISEAVYDGRLRPEPGNQHQRLLLSDSAHPALRPTGIRFVAVEHDGCSQRSREEAALVRDLYLSLLQQRFIDRDGEEHQVTCDDVLVVAPYNMQVNLLKETLPKDARVGTVDKFQGQEAQVVIVSLATSSGEYLPRFMEFLYSKNRLNVALSRARCLAVLVASPKLMAIKCHTVEQIELVNTLCWVQEYARRFE